MKQRTKNFFEDIFILFLVLLTVFLIYFFVFSNSDEIEVSITNQDNQTVVLSSEDNFFINLYKEFKENFFGDSDITIKENNENKIIEKSENIVLENDNKIASREDILKNQDAKNNSSEDISEFISEEEDSEEIEKIESSSNSQEEKSKESEDKIQEESDTKDNQNNETKEIIPTSTTQDNVPVENQTSQDTTLKDEEKVQESNEKIVEKSEDEIKVRNIDKFFSEFEKDIYSSIERNIDKSNFRAGQFVNIRVTILKNGNFEQIFFDGGNQAYFNTIKPSIEKVFPLKIDNSLLSNFPRYYRMNINF